MHFINKKQTAILLLTCLTLLCWIFAIYQILFDSFFSSPYKAIPAYQTGQETDFLSSSPKQVSDYLKQYDKNISLISCHIEKNYADLYYYSPALASRFPQNAGMQFNLQAVITKKKIYFGNPVIRTDF